MSKFVRLRLVKWVPVEGIAKPNFEAGDHIYVNLDNVTDLRMESDGTTRVSFVGPREIHVVENQDVIYRRSIR